MHATLQHDNASFYATRRYDQQWIVVWWDGNEDGFCRAVDRWANDQELAFTKRDACRAKQHVLGVEPWLEMPEPDRPAPWIEWVSIGSLAVLVATLILRWVL